MNGKSFWIAEPCVLAARLALALGMAPAVSAAQSVNTAPTAEGTATLNPEQRAEPALPADVASTKTRASRGLLPRLGFGSSTDLTKTVTAPLDAKYDKYLTLKEDISKEYNFQFGIDVSYYGQWSSPGTPPVWLTSYYPTATWRPFTDTSFGSGKFDFTIGHQAYFSRDNTSTQASRLGLITFANDWVDDNLSLSTIAYTHTLPSDASWLSITAGQFNLFSFDPNAYAANAQTTFISYSFAQDATQTFPNAGLGGYLQAKLLDGKVQLASGAQGATDLSGRSLTGRGLDTGKVLYFGNAQWRPTFSTLGSGVYSLLAYDQPSVPTITSQSTGVSFSASQAITDDWGVFFRASNATGTVIPIRTSLAAGGVWNDPLYRNGSDQVGLAVGWNKTNRQALSDIPGGARGGEWVSELYYRFTIFKGLNLTPDFQVFWNPASMPDAGPAAVFTLRFTGFL